MSWWGKLGDTQKSLLVLVGVALAAATVSAGAVRTFDSLKYLGSDVSTLKTDVEKLKADASALQIACIKSGDSVFLDLPLGQTSYRVDVSLGNSPEGKQLFLSAKSNNHFQVNLVGQN